jgi:multiple sugar transport system substrate-binding protein
MHGMTRRTILAGSAAAALARPALAQGKPEKLILVGVNAPIQGALLDEVAPEFERQHGIKIEFNMLPIDALSAKLRAELNAGSPNIDILQWNPAMTGWLSPHLEDHAKLLREVGAKHPDYDWDDVMPSVQGMATYDGKLQGIPFRVTAPVLHYQKQVLEQAGFAAPPKTFAELRAIAAATTAAGAPNRFGMGLIGRQGPGLSSSFAPFVFSSGGRFYNRQTGEIFINRPEAVGALEFFAGLVRDRLTPPEVTTWEYDEIIAGGQSDRYAMASTFAPYGTLLNDPARSRTTGKWAWAILPGATDIAQSTTTLGGWSFAVPKTSRQKEWAFELILMATNKRWSLRSMERGNAPPRKSVLQDEGMRARFGWASVSAQALERAEELPNDPLWPSFDQRLRVGVSQAMLGQATPRQALDAVADDWARLFRRAPAR